MRYYILEGESVIPVDAIRWALWFESNKSVQHRQVGFNTFPSREVSTVFVGLSAGRKWDNATGLPIESPIDDIFETAIRGTVPLDHEFQDDGWEVMERYGSLQDARAGHERYVQQVKAEHESFEKWVESIYAQPDDIPPSEE